MIGLFDTFIYEPIYNALAFIINITPGADIGIAIIVLTLIIKFILFPLSLKAVRTQAAMREIDPELKKIKEEFKENREEQARRTMALLKDKKINPFASFLLILIQLPVIIGLYFVFLGNGGGIGFDPAVLYSFISVPENVSFNFLGIIDLSGRSIALAALVAATQFVNARLMMPNAPDAEAGTLKGDLAKSMHMQMRWVFPIVMGVVAYVISAAIALYFLISNLFQLFQELYVKHNQSTDANGESQH
ncbi:MAG: YidC/Oxa1 family membrane protein insertase [Patescibacteria group bacterium UBA2163]